MYTFPKNLYTDVRIENLWETNIIVNDGELNDIKERQVCGAFLRIFDGEQWHYSSFAGKERIQQEIDKLAAKIKPNINIDQHPLVKRMQANKDRDIKFTKNALSNISTLDKLDVLKSYIPEVEKYKKITTCKAQYRDVYFVKEFYSSKGADLQFDVQRAGVAYFMTFKDKENVLNECYEKTATDFNSLKGLTKELNDYIVQSEDFVSNVEPVKPDNYTCVFSPLCTGVFAHECFGHRSEADFAVGSDAMTKDFVMGKRLGKDFLSIVDSSVDRENEYLPYDDEGFRGQETYIVKNGILNTWLHNGSTSLEFDQQPTGNARAIDFTFEPIVRMTSTYIAPGDMTKEELIAGVKNGIYVESIFGGGGVGMFTISPIRCYKIENGKITKPVNVSMVSGNTLKALDDIDAVSKEFEVFVKLTVFCGKPDQLGLRVGLGGSYMRVNNLIVK